MTVRFEVLPLRQWAKLVVQRSFTIKSLKSLLSDKLNCDFKHFPIKSFAILSLNGKMVKKQISY